MDGKYIGKNTNLKKLDFDVCYEHLDERERNNFEAFCRGIANNRSIETLCITENDLPDVETFVLFSSTMTIYVKFVSLAVILVVRGLVCLQGHYRGDCSSLRKIDLRNSYLGGEQSEELMVVLSGYHNLVKLSLGRMIGQGLCTCRILI